LTVQTAEHHIKDLGGKYNISKKTCTSKHVTLKLLPPAYVISE